MQSALIAARITDYSHCMHTQNWSSALCQVIFPGFRDNISAGKGVQEPLIGWLSEIMMAKFETAAYGDCELFENETADAATAALCATCVCHRLEL